MLEQYPIHALIESRCKALGIRRGELARRCGFRNVEKGLRRIDALCEGDLASPGSVKVMCALPAALELDKSVVEQALQKTAEIVAQEECQAAAERDAAWRASFKPSAYLLGTKTRPSQITIYGLTGGSERWLKIPLDLSLPPVTFAAQAHEVVRRTPFVQFFGPTTGFIVNYTPDDAVRYDLNGEPVEHRDAAYRPGIVKLFIGKQRVPDGWLCGSLQT
jgi:hypothetical protein